MCVSEIGQYKTTQSHSEKKNMEAQRGTTKGTMLTHVVCYILKDLHPAIDI